MARETEVQKCRACGAEIVFLRCATVNKRTGKRSLMPVDAGKVERNDFEFDPTRHTSHFATCSDPDRFSKR